MQSNVYMDPVGDSPMFGENHVRARRGAISQSTRRQSAPPRPPRPELNPWPKEEPETRVVEVSTDNAHYYYYDEYVETRPQDWHLVSKQPHPGRISPISPVSEEALSSAGYYSSDVSPSNSLSKKDNGRPALRRRPFSFESMRGTESCYSQDDDMASYYEQYVNEDDFDYTDIAMSNPYEFQREAEEMRPYASHTYVPGPHDEVYEDEPDYDYDAEPQLCEGVETASVISMVRPQSFIVPMSRYNSQESQHRAPPPSPDASEPGKTLDEAWEDVKKAVAPRLKIAIPPSESEVADESQGRASSSALTPPTSTKPVSRNVAHTLPSTEHALPPVPSPPPVPVRNPRRLTIGVSRNATVASTTRPCRLSQSTSSPNISRSYLRHSHVPPVPALPSEALFDVGSDKTSQSLQLRVPASLLIPAASDCSSSSDSHSQSTHHRYSSPAYVRHSPSQTSPHPRHQSLHQSQTVSHRHRPYHSHRYSATSADLIDDSPIVPPLPLSASFKRSSMGQSASSLSPNELSPRSRGFHEPPPVAPSPARNNTVGTSRPANIGMPSHKPTRSEANVPLSPGIWSGPSKLQGASFTTEIWAGQGSGRKPPTQSKSIASISASVPKALTLRTILPGDSSNRTNAASTARTQPVATSETASYAASTGTSSQAASTATLPSTLTTITPTTSTPRTPTRHRQEMSDGTITALPTAPPCSPASIPASIPASVAASLPASEPSAPADPFAPLKLIPLSPKFNATSADDYLPKFSNNFAGFCKCAWRYQTAQTDKAFSLRSVSRKTPLPNNTVTTTKSTTLKCRKCNFEGPLTKNPILAAAETPTMGQYQTAIDLSRCADRTPYTAHGVVYRWSFLFKSHIPSRDKIAKDESMDPHSSGSERARTGDESKPPAQIFGCLFCCAEGKGTVCFEGAKKLCGHIARCHPMGVTPAPEKRLGSGERELRMRVGVVIGRRPDRGEERTWDIILPGRRERDDRTVKNWL